MAMTFVHDFLVVTFRCHVAIQGSMQTHRLNSTVLAAVLPRSAFAYIGCGLDCGFVTTPSYDYSKPTFENYREDSFWQGYDVTYINTHTRVHVCVCVSVWHIISRCVPFPSQCFAGGIHSAALGSS